MRKGLRLTSILLVFTLLLLLGVRWAEREDLLNLTTARIDNSGLADSMQIAETLKPCFGSSLLKLDTDSLESRLLAVDGVDSVTVRIRYPDTIIISMSTRRPAAILSYCSRSIPVTVSGDHLPVEWGNDQLPVISIVGDPEVEVISSALHLLIKRELSDSVLIQVSSREIIVTENGIRIILDPDLAAENWLTWLSINTMITDHTEEVDLRYQDQAVLRSTEET